ncbi:hypothetical protein GCM10017708_03090 [Arthrobacter citreus]
MMVRTRTHSPFIGDGLRVNAACGVRTPARLPSIWEAFSAGVKLACRAGHTIPGVQLSWRPEQTRAGPDEDRHTQGQALPPSGQTRLCRDCFLLTVKPALVRTAPRSIPG